MTIDPYVVVEIVQEADEKAIERYLASKERSRKRRLESEIKTHLLAATIIAADRHYQLYDPELITSLQESIENDIWEGVTGLRDVPRTPPRLK